jgi:hypothetical protein
MKGQATILKKGVKEIDVGVFCDMYFLIDYLIYIVAYILSCHLQLDSPQMELILTD